MKQLISNYSFDASEGTVVFSDFASISLNRVLLITNLADNIIIYNFAGLGKGGSASGNTLTLAYDTDLMDDADLLQIFYDFPQKDEYSVSNIEEAGSYKYYGYETRDGMWYIMRKTLATNIYLYYAGLSGYSTGWTNRTSHTYVAYSAAF